MKYFASNDFLEITIIICRKSEILEKVLICVTTHQVPCKLVLILFMKKTAATRYCTTTIKWLKESEQFDNFTYCQIKFRKLYNKNRRSRQ
jgi:hypothetical protein